MEKTKIKKDLSNKIKEIDSGSKIRGITLISLIITIILLLILAGITISQLSNTGLFGKAKVAKEQYKNAQEDEEAQIAKYSNEINSILGTRLDSSSSAKVEKLWEAAQTGLREANLTNTGKNLSDYDLIIVEWDFSGYGFTITFNKFSPSTLRNCYCTGPYLLCDFTLNKNDNKITMECTSDNTNFKSTTNTYLTRVVGVKF